MVAEIHPGVHGGCSERGPRLDLYWIPLGADARVVRATGRIYETLLAGVQRRPRCGLYHSALVADTGQTRYVMEMTPVPADARDRGVVGRGPVGSRLLGRFRVFRYEIRRWRDGVIPDLGHAIDSPVCVSVDPAVVCRVLDLVPQVPTPVWGRDELNTGEMWNSNSVVSWVLTGAGLLDQAGPPPRQGRAPGWDAGVLVARRSTTASPREGRRRQASSP